jgi:hypothetical protein
VTFRPFSEAREYVRSLGFKHREEWYKWCRSGEKPDYIPARPDVAYEKDWISWGDWLGTGIVAPQKREFLPFFRGKRVCSFTWPQKCT